MSGLLNRSGFANSTYPAVQLISVSANTTLTGVQDMKVFVASDLSPITVTLPAGAKGQTIEIIDSGDNAGSNIITVAGTIDGATNTTIETDGGVRTFVFNTAWESGGGIERLFTRNAALGRITSRDPDALAANQLLGGDTGTTYSGGPSNFSNADANVSQGASGWGNTTTDGSAIEPTAVASSINVSTPTSAYDNNTGTSASSTSNSNEIVFDLGSSQTFAKVILYARFNNIAEVKIFTSDSPSSAFVQFGSTFTSAGGAGTLDNKEFTDSQVTKRYIKYTYLVTTLNYGGAERAAIYEIDAYDIVYATTTNTFQYRPLTGGASTNFDTATFTAKDDTATNLVNGDILIEYSLDQGSTWPGGQRSLNDFKALGVLTGTNFWLKFEMVGAKKLGSTSITTASSYAEMVTGSMRLRDQGVITGALLNSSLQTHTLTGASPSQALAMGTYNNFLVDINDATVGATLTFSSPVVGQTYFIKVRQGDNALNITWPGTIIGAAGANPSAITATNNAVDLFVFFYDGTNFILINEKQNLS